jgi:ATP phosphoribosyltransferase
MKSKDKSIKIAVQAEGRLSIDSFKYLNNLGLYFDTNGRKYVKVCKNQNVEVLLLRDDDIPEYVYQGVADFGIVGMDVLNEQNLNVKTVTKLKFAKCRLVLAVPNTSRIQSVVDLEGERIATSYPNILKRYLEKNAVNAAIIPISGKVEITPGLNLADAIFDITQSGTTLKENGLVEIETILNSQAVLIKSPNTLFSNNLFNL